MKHICYAAVLAVLIAGCAVTDREEVVERIFGAEDLEIGKSYLVNGIVFKRMGNAKCWMELVYSDGYEEKEIYHVPTSDDKVKRFLVGFVIKFTELKTAPDFHGWPDTLTNFEYKLIWPNY